MRKTLKKIFITFLAITLLGGTNLSGVYANTEIADSVNSVSNFNFDNEDTEDTEKPTGPVDPEFPDHEIDPDDNEDGGNGSTGNTGRLRIDYVSDFAFGAHSIESGSQTFYAKLISASADHGVNGKLEVPNFVQVSDLRGSAAGWTLYVKQDEPFEMVSGEMAGTTFEGMQITLNNIIANTVNDSGKVHVPNSTIPLNTMDEYKEILIANEGQGVGTHVAHFGEYEQGEKESALESVELFIPEDHAKVIGKYKTTLTWNLSSVPLNGGNGSDPELDYISITTAPDKTDYIVGETFNPDGMVVTAHYTDDSSEVVTDYTWSPDGALSESDEIITVSYTEDDITRTAEQAITVEEKTLTSIAVTKAPAKTAYVEGEKFNANGMEVTAHYNNGTSEPVANYTYTPNSTTSLTTSNTAVTISYAEGSITKTATQPITVAAKTLISISVLIYPNTSYTEGEYFDKTGMWVYANYNNSTAQRITTYTYSPTRALKTSDTIITLSYTEKGVTKTTTLPITVKEAKSEDQKNIDSIDDKEEFEEIELGGETWIILSKNKTAKTAELLHKRGLSQTRAYHKANSGTWSWSGSDIKSYLNNDFHSTLSADFRKSIQSVPKTTVLPGYRGTESANEKVYLLSRSEYNTYESKFKGTLYNYGLRSSITTGWWLRDADTGLAVNGALYVISNLGYPATAGHNTANLQGVRPVVTVKYK